MVPCPQAVVTVRLPVRASSMPRPRRRPSRPARGEFVEAADLALIARVAVGQHLPVTAAHRVFCPCSGAATIGSRENRVGLPLSIWCLPPDAMALHNTSAYGRECGSSTAVPSRGCRFGAAESVPDAVDTGWQRVITDADYGSGPRGDEYDLGRQARGACPRRRFWLSARWPDCAGQQCRAVLDSLRARIRVGSGR